MDIGNKKILGFFFQVHVFLKYKLHSKYVKKWWATIDDFFQFLPLGKFILIGVASNTTDIATVTLDEQTP